MKILRHNLVIRFVHWITALSIFILIFTGLGQMPVYRRYNVDQIPGLGWSSDFLITLNIHYIAAAVLIFISIYYLTYLIGTRRFDILPQRGDVKESIKIFASIVGLAEEPQNSKYLAEQRLAFMVTAVSVLILILTGLIKVYKNLPGVDASVSLIFWSAMIHNLFTFILIFSIIVHLLAFLIKDNRPLVPSMFTGKIDLAYVQRRHQLWLDEPNNNKTMGKEADPSKEENLSRTAESAGYGPLDRKNISQSEIILADDVRKNIYTLIPPCTKPKKRAKINT